jgi:signal transduction histidine kinase
MRHFFHFKTILVFIALCIACISLVYVTHIVKHMEEEERRRVALLVEGIQSITTINDPNQVSADFTYTSKVIDGNNSIPLIITDANNQILSHVNIDSHKIAQRPNYLQNRFNQFKEQHTPLKIQAGSILNYVYYGDSALLNELRYYPYVLFAIILVFIVIIYVIISNVQKSIQNQVWVGMSKETAHQLGTPLTSIVGWMELLKDKEDIREWVQEMEKDVERLQLVADRFSKIGSVPQLEDENLYERLVKMVDYMQKRSPVKVNISLQSNETDVHYLLSAPLFDWVIENLIRNALDAMEGKGEIKVILENSPRVIHIDIIDTGKGIAKANFKKVFTPGFSTKKRGWGLGLSLAKRIVEQFHNGNIFVRKSELGQGTTFRIILRR